MPESDPSPDRSRSADSRLLYRVDQWTSRPLVALIVLVADLVWILISFAGGFPGRSETVFQTLVAALTLAMVFVIQHTQARQQAATQRKLDEILRALPGADNALLSLEHASDEELRASGHMHREIRQAALAEQDQLGQAGKIFTLATHLTRLLWSGLWWTDILVMTILPLNDVDAAGLSPTRWRPPITVIVTRNGRPHVMVISVDDFESLQSARELLAEPGAVRTILAADRDISAGDYHELDELRAALDERQRLEAQARERRVLCPARAWSAASSPGGTVKPKGVPLNAAWAIFEFIHRGR